MALIVCIIVWNACIFASSENPELVEIIPPRVCLCGSYGCVRGMIFHNCVFSSVNKAARRCILKCQNMRFHSMPSASMPMPMLNFGAKATVSVLQFTGGQKRCCLFKDIYDTPFSLEDSRQLWWFHRACNTLCTQIQCCLHGWGLIPLDATWNDQVLETLFVLKVLLIKNEDKYNRALPDNYYDICYFL